MKVLVDTPIWSLALRRKNSPQNDSVRVELGTLIQDGRVAILGPIRQEILSGIKEQSQFERLRDHLRSFVDTPIGVEDYEEAAAFFNRCRSSGLQGSNTDFLICATAVRNGFSIYTTDEDFIGFARVLPIALHDAAR